MIDRQQAAALVHHVGKRVPMFGPGHAEIDPVVDAEDVGVADSCRHFHGAHEDEVGGRIGVEIATLADRVVIGDGEKVEPGLTGCRVQQLG
ncbi:hypothetical protein D3C72_2071480 [compost metagenome]